MKFTDALSRQIQDAHRSLLAHTPSQINAGMNTVNPASQCTNNMSRAVRKKSWRSTISVEEPRESKRTRAYGSQETLHFHGSQDIFEFHGSSDGELEKISLKGIEYKRSGSVDPSKRRRHSFDNMVPAAKVGALERSIPLSSLMKHPGEQLQLSQTDTIPTIADPTPLQTPSIPLDPSHSIIIDNLRSFDASDSDGRMPTPTVSSHSHTDESNSIGKAENKEYRHGTIEQVHRDHQDDYGKEQEPNSSVSIISPSRVTMARKLNEQFVEPYKSDNYDHDELQMSPPSCHAVGSTNPILLLSEHQSHTPLPGKDSPALTHNRANDSSVVDKAPKRKRQNDDQVDDLGSDELSIGLPKEQYQPRPSRSRGNRNNEELIVPTDYSRRPEAAAKYKKKGKRYKSTNFVDLISAKDDEDEEDEDQGSCQTLPELNIPDFVKNKNEDAEIQENADAIANDHDIMVEPPDKKSNQRKQRGRPKKDLEKKSARGEIEDSADHERTKETSDDIGGTEMAINRRRPSKTSLASVVHRADRNMDDHTAVGGGATQQETPSVQAEPRAENALDEISGNKAGCKSTQKSLDESPKALKTMTPPATPEKPVDSAVKGPDKHSPLSSGKVAYRVGLSKRARIAPLLRMVRK